MVGLLVMWGFGLVSPSRTLLVEDVALSVFLLTFNAIKFARWKRKLRAAPNAATGRRPLMLDD